jgi:hypothetical protein
MRSFRGRALSSQIKKPLALSAPGAETVSLAFLSTGACVDRMRRAALTRLPPARQGSPRRCTKEDARMADQGKEKPGGRKTEDAQSTPGTMAPPPRVRQRAPALTKAELRAQANQALASATKPIVKLPTKLVRQCGRCGEFCSVMVEPGQAPPEFKCKSCDAPARG